MHLLKYCLLVFFLLGKMVIPLKALSFWDEIDSIEDNILSALSDEEKIGQLFLVTYPGNTMTKELEDWITKKNLGGIKIFGWNAVDIHKLIETIHQGKSLAKKTRYQIPLFISTDQEGGWVQHIKEKMTASVGNLGLSATNSPWDSYQTGYYIGKELQSIGVNMNFAPTVDLYTNYDNLVISSRSFSPNPYRVSLWALAYYKGLKEAGIIATAKHFPGHGESLEDSHGTLPKVNLTLSQIQQRELIPYHILIKEGIPAIMVGHLLFDKISSEVSSLSHFFLSSLLRDTMKFNKIVVTDDLIMQGASVKGLKEEYILEKALRAGNTLLLSSAHFNILERVRQHFLKLMKIDSKFLECVNEAVKRNMKVKFEYLKKSSERNLGSVEESLSRIPDLKAQEIFQNIAFKSVTLLKNDKKIFSSQKKTLIITTYPDMIKEAKNFFTNFDSILYPYLPLKRSHISIVKKIQSLAPYYDQIVFNLTTPASVKYLETLQPWNDKLVVLSSLSPVLLSQVPWLKKSLAIYGINSISYKAGFSAILGKFFPKGVLPIKIKL